MKDLILLTTSYPFGVFTEAFLETEIQYLSERFETIYIIATKPQALFIRPLPSNVIVRKLPDNKMIQRSMYIICKSGNSIIKDVFYEVLYIIRRTRANRIRKLKELFKHIIKALLIEEYVSGTINLEANNCIIYSYWFNSSALAASLIKRRYLGVKAVSRLHGWDLYTENTKIDYLPLQKVKASSLDKCFFISNHGKQYFETKFLKSSSFVVSRLGTREQRRPEPKVENNIIKVVSCSSIIKGKRVHYIIESLALINEIEINWTHLGGGVLYEELNSLAFSKLATKRNITYKITGTITNSEVISFYRENFVHLFINTSVSEGIPMSIMEAMSFGIPVIATAVGGTPEIVNDSCGILLNVNCTFEEIKSSIIKICSNYDNYPYSKNAVNNWAENYDANNNYRNFVDQLFELM